MSKKKFFLMSVLVLVVACAAAARSFAEPSSSRDDEVVIVQSYFREVGLRIKDYKLFPTQRGGRGVATNRPGIASIIKKTPKNVG